jgi:hypothetical protein
MCHIYKQIATTKYDLVGGAFRKNVADLDLIFGCCAPQSEQITTHVSGTMM